MWNSKCSFSVTLPPKPTPHLPLRGYVGRKVRVGPKDINPKGWKKRFGGQDFEVWGRTLSRVKI